MLPHRVRTKSKYKKFIFVLSLITVPSIFAIYSGATGFNQLPNVSGQGNADAPWSFSGQNQQNTWYSPQTMINPANVGGLKVAWSTQIPRVYGPPVISNGVLYVNTGGYSGVAPGVIYALNETTGAILWRDGKNYSTGLDFSTRGGVTIDKVNIFAGTYDNQLVSLNATTGTVNWLTPISQNILGNAAGYYTGPSGSPLVYKDMVIVADTQGDVGARGFIRAFSETNGSLLWTFYTIPPAPMNSTNQALYLNSWGNCTDCGGGDIWSLPAIDPDTGLIYVGTGNPSPSYNSTERCPGPGYTNLFTASIIALNSSNGKLDWFYQTVPCDPHDWDVGMPVQLFNTTINGADTKVVGAGGKDGYYYELNAETGELICKLKLGIHFNDDKAPTPEGITIYPGSFGGVNSYSSYNSMTNMIYTIAYNQPSNYSVGPVDYNGGEVLGSEDRQIPGVPRNSTLYAIDASTGTIVWTMDMIGLGGGVSSTNNLVFTSDGNGVYYALNAQTGENLWSYQAPDGYFLGFKSRTPPSVTDGMLFETMYGDDGGVIAFTTNTTITESSYPSVTTRTTTSTSQTTTFSSSSSSKASWSISVQVLSPQGSPASGASVQLKLATLKTISSGETNSSGWITFSGISGGSYVLEASYQGEIADKQVQINGQNLMVTIQLAESPTITSSSLNSTQNTSSSTLPPQDASLNNLLTDTAIGIIVIELIVSSVYFISRRRG